METINTLLPLTESQVSDLLNANASHSKFLNLDADGFESKLMFTYKMEESWGEITQERGVESGSSGIGLEDIVDLLAMEAVDCELVSIIKEANIQVLECGDNFQG